MPLGAMIPLIAAGVSAVSGMAIQHKANREARRQNKQYQQDQVNAQSELNRRNQQMGLDTWSKTNYAAQRREMEKADLNPGLMYGMSGGGGTTMGNAGGSVGMGQAENQGQGMRENAGMGIEALMAAAQLKLMEAQANKTNVEAANIAGAQTGLQEAQTSNLQAITNNEILKNQIMQYEKEIKAIELNVKGQTQEEVIRQIQMATDKLFAETRQAANNANVSDETYDAQIQQIRQASVEQQLRIAGQQQGLEMTEAQMKKIAQEIIRMQQQTDQGQQTIDIQKLMQEFNTSTPQQIKQWTGIVTDIMSASKGGGTINKTYNEYGDKTWNK